MAPRHSIMLPCELLTPRHTKAAVVRLHYQHARTGKVTVIISFHAAAIIVRYTQHFARICYAAATCSSSISPIVNLNNARLHHAATAI